MIGLTVRSAEDGKIFGTLTSVLETGANDVYEIREPSGKTTLIPAIPQTVKRVSLEEGIIEIVPMEGMFDAD